MKGLFSLFLSCVVGASLVQSAIIVSHSPFEGEYRIVRQISDTGDVIDWTTGLGMSLEYVAGDTYIMKLHGKGEVRGNSIDCSKPFVMFLEIVETGEQKSSTLVDKGSCPEVFSSDQKVTWELTSDGLKKTKIYRDEECVVGPCDWIETRKFFFFYQEVK